MTHEPSAKDTVTRAGGGPPAAAQRVALAGSGRMAQHHATATARSPEPARVVAVADPSAAARRELVGAIDGAREFDTLEELLAQMPVDVVHICSPPHTHERLAAVALEAGCHVYVEKPFAASAAAAERLLAIAGDHGRLVCAGHQLLYEAPARRALELMPALGSVAHVESYFAFRTVRRSPDGRTPLRADLQLLDILPHPVYLLLRFLEEAEPSGEAELTAVEVGPGATVHALVRRGGVTGNLVVTLDGRPVDNYLRLVGTNGSVHADFVRGTVQRLIGPGVSGIDKLLSPYRIACQLAFGTTRTLGARALKRQRSYPGLVEIFEAFYRAIRGQAEPPLSPAHIVDTVRVCEQVADALNWAERAPRTAPAPADAEARIVAVTGGTGFLGRHVVRELLKQGTAVRVIARREPPAWERLPGAEYAAVDLSSPFDPATLDGVEAVIHCAAATSGGWEEHQAHSLDATEHVLRAAHAAGIRRFVHVSSLAVLQSAGGAEPVRDDSPLQADNRSTGPYVWGKLESERLAHRLCAELGIELRIVRPGALIDERDFDPPGKLGRRIGNLFVAVGSARDTLGTVDVRFAARTLAWLVDHFDEAPRAFNLLAPSQPTKRTLIQQLRRSNPDLRVVWLPRALLHPLSWAALGAQKVLRPGRPAIDVASVFSQQAFDTSGMSKMAPRIVRDGSGSGHRPLVAPSSQA